MLLGILEPVLLDIPDILGVVALLVEDGDEDDGRPAGYPALGSLGGGAGVEAAAPGVAAAAAGSSAAAAPATGQQPHQAEDAEHEQRDRPEVAPPQGGQARRRPGQVARRVGVLPRGVGEVHRGGRWWVQGGGWLIDSLCSARLDSTGEEEGRLRPGRVHGFGATKSGFGTFGSVRSKGRRRCTSRSCSAGWRSIGRLDSVYTSTRTPGPSIG